MNPAIITAITAIVVQLIVLAGIIYQQRSNVKQDKRVKTQLELTEDINMQITELREQNSKRDNEIIKSINELKLSDDKRWLLDFMCRVQNGEKMTTEQIKLAYETKERYNSLGGDSYIDDFWEKLKNKNLF